MRERAAEIGGSVTITPLNPGTSVRATLPPSSRMSDPISVVAVDDHPLFLAGLNTALGNIDDIALIGTAATGGDAVALTAELNPDVVLIELNSPTSTVSRQPDASSPTNLIQPLWS